MTSRSTLLPQVLPSQCLLEQARSQAQLHPELHPEPMGGFSEEPPLPGKTMEECSVSGSEQPRYYTPLSSRLDGQMLPPALDSYAKQWWVAQRPDTAPSAQDEVTHRHM